LQDVGNLLRVWLVPSNSQPEKLAFFQLNYSRSVGTLNLT
jgi:hypothetical protein